MTHVCEETDGESIACTEGYVYGPCSSYDCEGPCRFSHDCKCPCHVKPEHAQYAYTYASTWVDASDNSHARGSIAGEWSAGYTQAMRDVKAMLERGSACCTWSDVRPKEGA